MTLKIKYADVVVGKTTTRYAITDPEIKDIGIDPNTMALVVVKKSGEILSFFGCPYVISQEEVADIIVPTLVDTDIARVS